MKIIFLLAALIIYGLSEVQGTFMKSRNMINKVMGMNVIAEYNPYGCHCGQKGKGAPKDATDRCCWKQDCCYAEVEKEGCDTRNIVYRYRYLDGFISCGFGSYCEIRICSCDSEAAFCMQENRKSYNVKYHNLTNSQCKGKRPKC